MLGALIGLPEPSINIGFASHMELQHAHGRAWFHMPGTGLVAKPFVVDKPRLMKNATLDIVDQLFEQIVKLGVEPHSIEFVDDNYRYVYHYGNRRPVFKQRRLQP
jgi:hypothetical protein